MAIGLFKKFLRLFKGKKQKKLGLALGSGGVKGLAHIGALRAFEEEGIHFDFVAGTSIGSIVGAMYACGYSSSGMIEYIKNLHLEDPLTLIKMKLTGVTPEKLLDQVFGGRDIEELSLPFCAVAVNVTSGEEVDITTGSVATAVLASSAIPPMFKPVQIADNRLIDGAFRNAVPANVVKNMGADCVIGISLGEEHPTNEVIKISLDELYKDNGVPICDRLTPFKIASDFLLTPSLSAYKSTAISKMHEIYEIGYECAKRSMPEIKKVLKAKGIKLNKKS